MSKLLKTNKKQRSILSKNLADAVPFSADKKRKPFDVRYFMRDAKETDGRSKTDYVGFSSPVGASYYDLKVFLAVAKVAIDKRDLLPISYDAEVHPSIEDIRERECVSMSDVPVKDICRMLGVRTSTAERKRVVESVMNMTHMRTVVSGKGVGMEYRQWIYAPMRLDDEHKCNIMTFSMSRVLLDAVINGGLVYDFEKTMKYSGRALLMYVHMQTRKHEKKGRYFYNDTIRHSELIERLDLESDSYTPKEQVRHIKESFKMLVEDGFPEYEYNHEKSYWKKVIRPHEISA